MQVFVCGMHRSGTSVVARLLNLMGLYFGPEGSGLPANSENPLGFWERQDVIALNERLLASYGASWYDIVPFLARQRENDEGNPVASAVGAKLLDIDANRPWFIKDPRLCLTLPFWRRWAAGAIVVLCWRDPDAVAASLSRRVQLADIMFSYEDARALWDAYYTEVVAASLGMPRIVVRYEDVLAEPVVACMGLHDSLSALGVERLRQPLPAEVEAFVNRSLQRHRSPTISSETESSQIPFWLSDEETSAVLSSVSRARLVSLHERVQGRRVFRHFSEDEQRRIESLLGASTPQHGSWSLARLRNAVAEVTNTESSRDQFDHTVEHDS